MDSLWSSKIQSILRYIIITAFKFSLMHFPQISNGPVVPFGNRDIIYCCISLFAWTDVVNHRNTSFTILYTAHQVIRTRKQIYYSSSGTEPHKINRCCLISFLCCLHMESKSILISWLTRHFVGILWLLLLMLAIVTLPMILKWCYVLLIDICKSFRNLSKRYMFGPFWDFIVVEKQRLKSPRKISSWTWCRHWKYSNFHQGGSAK